jgi:glycosyl transferase family 25
MIFDEFDKIRIVSLPERKDRRRQMRGQLATVGLADDPRVAFFDAYRFNNPGIFRSAGSRGCFTSHSAIISLSATLGESVLILEDDCDFLPAARTYQSDGQWDVFYGGYMASDMAKPQNCDIIGSHFMGLSASAAKKAAAYFACYPDPDFPPDERSASEPGFNPNVRPGTDGAYVWFRRAHPELRAEFSMLSKQRSSRTDIGKLKWFDRAPVVRELAALARSLKGG